MSQNCLNSASEISGLKRPKRDAHSCCGRVDLHTGNPAPNLSLVGAAYSYEKQNRLVIYLEL